MSRDYKLYLDDILECCENVAAFTDGMDFDDFSADRKTVDAVVRNLEIIGEAVKNIPPEILLSKPEINWKQIAGFRDVIIHKYFRVDLEIVWDIAQNRLEELKKAVSEILADEAR